MTSQQIAFIILAAAAAVRAESAAAPLLVDVAWLSSHLKDPDLVILHVGPKADYDTAHILAARFVSLDAIATGMDRKDPTALTLELPSPEVLRAKLETFGISSGSRIVVYFGVKQAFQSSTRVIFTLDYMGFSDRTSLLNGGLPAWTGAGQPVTAEVAAVTPGKIVPAPTKDLVVDAEIVKTAGQRPHEKLIDARSPAFYNGTDATYEKKGHIPGALNIPFSDLLESSLMLDQAKVAKVFSTAGVKPGDTVIAYCHIGQQATAVMFAARLLGNPVKLYDGSFQDWAINSRGPVEK